MRVSTTFISASPHAPSVFYLLDLIISLLSMKRIGKVPLFDEDTVIFLAAMFLMLDSV